MRVGQAAERAGLPTKTVRYYADIGLVAPMGRSEAKYRIYGPTEIGKLAFIRRARAFGFSIGECRELLSLYEDKTRSSRDVKRLALHRLAQIDEKLADLMKLRDELAHLADACHGDERHDCPILDGLTAGLEAPDA